ncbi:glutamine amidotransferase [Luteimonas gilva]|uniref:Glutamine amidotransferase n=1 Tax=Luteimonas gilva TaxID=2572684 RepID=A0A4U5JVS8_9GAMM|nr:DJ-1/PfpI family protein [Luteimonas gilva]TKR34060.1 glutamine amidotransferase [Luteimonas gilva]
MTKTVAVVMVDGPADWEMGPVLAAVREWFGMNVITATEDGQPIVSIGGVTILPQRKLADLAPTEADLWILPGSDAWRERIPPAILEGIKTRVAAGKPVAAICGATVALATAGLLEDRPHTSNSLQFLKDNAPNYGGGGHYVDRPCVSDGLVVSASGMGPIGFAVECLRILAPERQAMIEEVRASFAREFA